MRRQKMLQSKLDKMKEKVDGKRVIVKHKLPVSIQKNLLEHYGFEIICD